MPDTEITLSTNGIDFSKCKEPIYIQVTGDRIDEDGVPRVFQLKITDEGIIADLYEDGVVVKTSSSMFDEFIDEMLDS
jgi:hypothetical protein